MPSDLDARWDALQAWLKTRFRKTFSVEGVLFLIGVQERGLGYAPKLEKEDKQDLIMEATYAVLETQGLYARTIDADGQPTWEATAAPPELSVDAQEALLKSAILAYFAPILDDNPSP